MRTLVIILAQGSQTRLPALTVAKQLLPLPACADLPILWRTTWQAWTMLVGEAQRGAEVGWGVVPDGDHGHDVRLITWPHVYEALVREPGFHVHTSVTVLDEPGNSSLKGFAFALDRLRADIDNYERVVCLLGDVVYSWACLEKIFGVSSDKCIRFVGTSDLSTSDGELWGFAWHRSARGILYEWLNRALEKHPRFHAYQPGQMRRLVWEAPADARSSLLLTCDDYTRDIDLPEHVEMLPQLSLACAADDAERGVLW